MRESDSAMCILPRSPCEPYGIQGESSGVPSHSNTLYSKGITEQRGEAMIEEKYVKTGVSTIAAIRIKLISKNYVESDIIHNSGRY
eukprot:scaffold4734_cov261-Chaetoceros_neogracile.AAC.7